MHPFAVHPPPLPTPMSARLYCEWNEPVDFMLSMRDAVFKVVAHVSIKIWD